MICSGTAEGLRSEAEKLNTYADESRIQTLAGASAEQWESDDVLPD